MMNKAARQIPVTGRFYNGVGDMGKRKSSVLPAYVCLDKPTEELKKGARRKKRK